MSLTLLPDFGTLSFQLCYLVLLGMRICAQSYCNLLHHVWLISLGGQLFSKGKWRMCGSGKESAGTQKVLGGEERDIISLSGI